MLPNSGVDSRRQRKNHRKWCSPPIPPHVFTPDSGKKHAKNGSLHPRDGGWIEFLNCIKYPPSLVFSLFMLGANLMLARTVRGDWLRTIGQVPLFFYLAHLYLYAVVGALFFREGTGLGGLYGVWVAGLVPLYFACCWYKSFKEAKPADSFWRFF